MAGSLLSIVLLGEGILTGLTLTIMLGPVTMTILRYGIQVNRTAGVLAATGTWVSDFVFIAGTFFMTASLNEWTNDPSVRFWIYIISGIGLIVIGLWMTKSKSKSFAPGEFPTSKSYSEAFASGFIVNSLSPFTLFFWTGAAVILHMQGENPMSYYIGVMISLAAGDFLKAWFSPKLTRWIKDKYVYWFQVVAGALIMITGMFMIGMGFWE